jgi:hypothetical protein
MSREITFVRKNFEPDPLIKWVFLILWAARRRKEEGVEGAGVPFRLGHTFVT